MIIPLREVDARYEPQRWAFADDQRARIDDHWQTLVSSKLGLWNGTVLVQHRWSIEDGVYRAGYMDVDFASFIAWRDFGCPGPPARNGFGMAALRGTDGAFLLGVMADHTANAGKIYFPGGTPDLNDLTEDGRVDIAASLLRELQEETGLMPGEFEIVEQWYASPDANRVAFMKPVRLAMTAAEARDMLLPRLAVLPEQELSDLVIVRKPEDIDPVRTPDWAANFMRMSFLQSRS